AALTSALEVARRLDLSMSELVDILKTKFINPNAVIIPLAEPLGLSFATIEDLHAGKITAATLTTMLPAGLDTTPYGDVAAWLTDPANYARIMGLLVIKTPTADDP